MPRVDFTHPAREDLIAIWEYIGRDNVDAADRFVDRVTETCALYAAHPNTGQRAERLAAGLRCFAVGHYVVFYVPQDDGILVYRVLHGARNLDELLGRDSPSSGD